MACRGYLPTVTESVGGGAGSQCWVPVLNPSRCCSLWHHLKEVTTDPKQEISNSECINIHWQRNRKDEQALWLWTQSLEHLGNRQNSQLVCLTAELQPSPHPRLLSSTGTPKPITSASAYLYRPCNKSKQLLFCFSHSHIIILTISFTLLTSMQNTV